MVFCLLFSVLKCDIIIDFCVYNIECHVIINTNLKISTNHYKVRYSQKKSPCGVRQVNSTIAARPITASCFSCRLPPRHLPPSYSFLATSHCSTATSPQKKILKLTSLRSICNTSHRDLRIT